jgi:predicted DNA-binding protein
MMVRTQIQLTEMQARRLKQLAAATGRSMADLIRSSIDATLAQPDAGSADEKRHRALSVVGRFHSGAPDLATAHDRHLADAFSR